MDRRTFMAGAVATLPCAARAAPGQTYPEGSRGADAEASPKTPEAMASGGVEDAGSWGMVPNPAQDNTRALQGALDAIGRRGGGTLILPDRYFVGGDVTVPPNIHLRGAHRQAGLVTHGTIDCGHHGALGTLTLDFNGMTGTLLARDDNGADHLRLSGVTLTGSALNGFHARGVEDLILDDVIADGHALRGIYITRCVRVTARDVHTGHNGQTGFGLFYTDAAHLGRITARSNGTGGHFGGISFAGSSNVAMHSIIVHDNHEHGIGATGCDRFTLSGLVAYGNGRSGLNLQSGHKKRGYPPAQNGVVTGFNIYGNLWGITLKEDCRDILFSGGSCRDNTGKYNLRLVDIGQSGKKSSRIRAVGVDFVDARGRRVVNSNGSDWRVTDEG